MFSEIPAWVYDRTVWLRFTMLLRECEHTHAEIHIQPHKHTQEPPVCVSGSLWSMPQESSCCLYGCALCSLLLRGTQPCCSPDERACFSPSPAVRQKAWRLLAQILPCPANSLFYRNQPHLLQRLKKGDRLAPKKGGRHYKRYRSPTHELKNQKTKIYHGAYRLFCTCVSLAYF